MTTALVLVETRRPLNTLVGVPWNTTSLARMRSEDPSGNATLTQMPEEQLVFENVGSSWLDSL